MQFHLSRRSLPRTRVRSLAHAGTRAGRLGLHYGAEAGRLGRQFGGEAARAGRRYGRRIADDPVLAGAVGVGAALVAAAAYVQFRTRMAEEENPPAGRFVEVDGVTLHYVVRGRGKPLVLLHGNGSLEQDFMLSGLVKLAARHYRVYVFDRPGYGYSSRPRTRIWTPEAQADLLQRAFDEIGIDHPVVLGHSWGAMVAVALGLDHSLSVKSLVLLSGYYYPTLRADVPLAAPPAIPLIGDILRYTVSPLLARLTWRGVLRRIFGPNPVPEHFERFPKWMAFRPGHIRAAAAEAALMIPAARRLSRRYAELAVPVTLVAGGEDRQVDTESQTERLAAELRGSTLVVVPDVGHMIHHVVPDQVMAAIDAAAEAGKATPVRRRA